MPSCSQPPHVSLGCKLFIPCNGTGDEDRSSLASQDSGIPTLEINPPEHIHARVNTAELVVPPPLDDNPATLNLDISDSSLLKSSTFPRCDFDLVRLYGASGLSSAAGKGTLNRSDDISVCSVSSLSTEFSATLSVSNEDFLDFMVTSESSAVVTFENDDVLHRSDNSLSPPTNLHGKLSSPQRQAVGVSTPHEARPKRLGPLANFFHRYCSICICNVVKLTLRNQIGSVISWYACASLSKCCLSNNVALILFNKLQAFFLIYNFWLHFIFHVCIFLGYIWKSNNTLGNRCLFVVDTFSLFTLSEFFLSLTSVVCQGVVP